MTYFLIIRGSFLGKIYNNTQALATFFSAMSETSGQKGENGKVQFQGMHEGMPKGVDRYQPTQRNAKPRRFAGALLRPRPSDAGVILCVG